MPFPLQLTRRTSQLIGREISRSVWTILALVFSKSFTRICWQNSARATDGDCDARLPCRIA